MDHFSGARYPAYTLRRFYPQMRGRNLTFAPSQYYAPSKAASYGADAPGGTTGVEAPTSPYEILGAVGTDVVKFFAQEESLDRQAARDRAAKLAEARMESIRARSQAVAGGGASQVGGTSALPWIVGGVLALAGVGALVIYANK
jgi:hypothetical protein